MFEITREWAEGMIVEALVARGVPEDEARSMSDLSPLLAEHDAKVRAETLREARDNVRASSFWADGSDNYADRVRGYLSRAADRIEKEAGL